MNILATILFGRILAVGIAYGCYQDVLCTQSNNLQDSETNRRLGDLARSQILKTIY